ncbi:hypothetical protein KC929_03185 [Patescibacteria group bacterium]|nr:hypothetical protein [Patescibacteria group bacterium]
MKTFLLLICSIFLACNNQEYDGIAKHEANTIKVTQIKALRFAPELRETYKPSPITISNLSLPGEIGKFGLTGSRTEVIYGAMIRSLRYKNITDAVEDRYQLPRGILLAMIAKESHGIMLLPNGRDDGGFGLIHMQPTIAKKFHLRTYQNCDKHVCKKHGRELRRELEKYNFNLEEVYQLDERLDALKNIDAAGRMIAVYFYAKPITDRRGKTFSRFKSAMYRYAGSYNGPKYTKDIERYMERFQDKDVINALNKVFDDLNPDLMVNGSPADLSQYLKAFYTQNLSWGLKEYLDLPKLSISETEQSAFW